MYDVDIIPHVILPYNTAHRGSEWTGTLFRFVILGLYFVSILESMSLRIRIRENIKELKEKKYRKAGI